MAQVQWKQISPYLSGSGNLTGSLNLFGDQTVSGDMIVGGTITAQEFKTELISASILFESGSSLFGNSFDDTHIFTGSTNITGALFINGVDVDEATIFRKTGSFWATTNDLQVTGSFKVLSGSVTFEGIPWPASGEETHFLKTEGFSFAFNGVSRSYEYMGIALEHYDTPLDYYHNSLILYTYDNHDAPNYGAELNIGPIRSHLRQYASGSENVGNFSLRELPGGTVQALLYANDIQIGKYLGDTISIGNISSSIDASGSFDLELNGVDQYFSVNINGTSQVKVNNEGIIEMVAKEETPTAVAGGMFYSSSNEFYLGFSN